MTANIINLSLFKALILKIIDRLHMLHLRYFNTSGSIALSRITISFFLWTLQFDQGPIHLVVLYCCSSILTDLLCLFVVVVCLFVCFWWEELHALIFKLVSHFQQYQSSVMCVPKQNSFLRVQLTPGGIAQDQFKPFPSDRSKITAPFSFQ